MTYKGTNWTRGELGNVLPRNPTVECAEPTCSATTKARQLPGEWQATNNPSEVVLCPSCKQRVRGTKRTPSEMRRENNSQLTDWGMAPCPTTEADSYGEESNE